MNILMLTPAFLPGLGGVERHVYQVARELAARENQVTVLTWTSRGAIPGDEEMDGLRVRRLSVVQARPGFRLAARWCQLASCASLIRQADVVHCHDNFFDYLPFRFLWPRKPAFVTFHGWEGRYPPTWKAIWLRRLAACLAWGNICVGHYLEKWYGVRADRIVYGGVSAPAVGVANARTSTDIIFIGRLAEDTGVNLFLDALLLLQQEYGLDLSVDICGDGPLKAALMEKSRQAGLHVTYHGFVTDVGPYLEKSRFVVTTGYLSILEAMIHRRLVFGVYDNPLKRDCLLAPWAKMMLVAGSALELARELAHYHANPQEAVPLIEQAYAWASGQTWSRVAETYLSLYRDTHNRP